MIILYIIRFKTDWIVTLQTLLKCDINPFKYDFGRFDPGRNNIGYVGCGDFASVGDVQWIFSPLKQNNLIMDPKFRPTFV